jgi:hypothetical protein
MIASVINQKRFERLEQQLGGIVDAERAVALLAHDAPQFLQDQIGARNLFAAQQARSIADQ